MSLGIITHVLNILKRKLERFWNGVKRKQDISELCDALKAVLKGKLIELKACIRKVSNEWLWFPPKETRKEAN